MGHINNDTSRRSALQSLFSNPLIDQEKKNPWKQTNEKLLENGFDSGDTDTCLSHLPHLGSAVQFYCVPIFIKMAL